MLWSVLAAPFVPGVAEGDVRVTGVDLAAGADGPIVVENGPEADLLLVLRGDRAELVRLADVRRRRARHLDRPPHAHHDPAGPARR